MTQVFAISAFDDNYIWCIHDGNNAIVVDPGDASVVEKTLLEHKLTLQAILITHHHYDHTGGVLALAETRPDLVIYGPKNRKIKGITHPLEENDSMRIVSPQITLKVMETPGHTMDHIAYYNDELIFCGDTLFSAGCGRMFEGSPEVFYDSLQKIASLPHRTKVYCTHEYTQANVAFAKHVLPENDALNKYSTWVDNKRTANEITLPSDIQTQLAINPFLRCGDEKTRNNINHIMNLSAVQPVEVFAALRACKDNF